MAGNVISLISFILKRLKMLRKGVSTRRNGASKSNALFFFFPGDVISGSLVHSLAGGTSSDLGTRVTESCGDEFPDVTRVNLAVSPYHFGEVAVQHYNALLSLSPKYHRRHMVLFCLRTR